jgi:hypothetical protein
MALRESYSDGKLTTAMKYRISILAKKIARLLEQLTFLTVFACENKLRYH